MSGWKLVPCQPTEGMLVDGALALRNFYSKDGPYPRTKAMYRAMTSAAPEPPEELIEKVARAICCRTRCVFPQECNSDAWLPNARAVIKALEDA